MKAKIKDLIERLEKISLASACLMFMIVTTPLIEQDIDWLQGQKEKLIINNLRLEINISHTELDMKKPGIPSDIIQKKREQLNEIKSELTIFWNGAKIIEDFIDKLKLVKTALLIAPIIIFTLAEIYRVENELRIAKYMVYIGIVTVIVLLIVRRYIWSALSSSLPL